MAPRTWTSAALAALIDHTLLAADATPARIERLCAEARAHAFAAVCVNGAHVRLAAGRLTGSTVAVCAVVGFPLGAMATRAKVEEARLALDDGARELDMVLALGALKAGDDAGVVRDVAGVAELAHAGGARVKVILETGLLAADEVERAARLAVAGGADFVKTSTGFGPRGASLEDVRRLRAAVGPEVGVKASGGVRTRAFALELLEAGATRLGTSAGVELVRES